MRCRPDQAGTVTNQSGILSFLVVSTLAGLVAQAQAAVVDRPTFRTRGMVIVWGGSNGGGVPLVNDLYIENDSGGYTDLISGDVQPVITGTLTPVSDVVLNSSISVSNQTIEDDGNGVLDANDSLSPFSPQETLTLDYESVFKSSFYVASNIAFSIQAVAQIDGAASDADAELVDIIRTMEVERSGLVEESGTLRFGDAARFPHTDNHPYAGVVMSNNGYLSKLATKQTVFAGNRGTADGPGTIAEQSVRFTNTYEIPAGQAFHKGAMAISASVVYTVAVP